jgi:hypothetical protein
MFIFVFRLVVFRLRFVPKFLRNSKVWKKHRNCFYSLLYNVSVCLSPKWKEHFA